MRVFTIPTFEKWRKKSKLSHDKLIKSAEEVERGLSVNLGGVLVKKRIAKGNRGKSGGFRTILAYQNEDRIFYLFGFNKNERENISEKERKVLNLMGREFLSASDEKLEYLKNRGDLLEIN